MRAPVRASVVVAVLGVLLAGPASAGLFSDDEARQALNEQSKQVLKLQNEKQALEARVAKLEETLRNQGLLDLLTQIDGLNAEISKLRGQSEVQANGLDAAQKRQKDFYIDLDSRLRRLEQGSAAGAPPAPSPGSDAAPASGPGAGANKDAGNALSATGSGAAAGTSAANKPESPAAAGSNTGNSAGEPRTAADKASPTKVAAAGAASEAGAYEATYTLFKGGDYAGAVSGFQNFLRQYPASPLASNAQYWIGNAQFAQRDFAAAIGSQKKLLAAYPGSQKAPDALLNIANAQSEMGDTAASKKTLQDVIARFPSTEAGEKARRRLSLLK